MVSSQKSSQFFSDSPAPFTHSHSHYAGKTSVSVLPASEMVDKAISERPEEAAVRWIASQCCCLLEKSQDYPYHTDI